MKKVTGIGGIFFKSKDPKAIQQWYKKHLGLPVEEYGAALFQWKEADSNKPAVTVWSAFKQDSNYFDPSQKEFMINFRVENLKDLLEQLKQEGVQVMDKIEEHAYGKFGWIIDPEGNKIELWEPAEESKTE